MSDDEVANKIKAQLDSDRPLAICLMGPTASGKTDLAVALAAQLPCEIISVDSALIYRDMNIGTAKPDAETLRQAPHALVDILDPSESYSAARFRDDALAEMAAIKARGNTPLLVGGTMMYFKALLYGIADLPAADVAVRTLIEKDAKQHGWAHVHAQLALVDAVSADRIKPTDSQRIQRALEVYRVSGKNLTAWQAEQTDVGDQRASTPVFAADLAFTPLLLALAPADRAVLHRRIAQRFQAMMKQGFIEEVKALHQRGDLHTDLPAIRAVGYRQVWDYLQGELEYEAMLERGIITTRQLAKRQLTWLRSWSGINWLYTDEQNSRLQNEQQGLRDKSPVDGALYFLQEFLS
ncbi:MAG: tRNA (adenosine(37)-N6)-dimethylallyltransferase MiaA [Pseudomonadales bacterium]